MIILKHLTVERFRLLREMNLHFPQRGSILIQGPNESGKSALLESIYFALYGESLTLPDPNRGTRSLDDLILYGATNAVVTLTLLIGATELTITRTIERGKGQRVTLRIHRLGLPEEGPIVRVGAANERIISELGRMDGESLRNSCMLEQKGLTRLENLRGSEREATLGKLLGLEKLTRLTEQFKITPHDERLLNECAEQLRLAEIQARVPELSRQLDQCEAALDAVAIAEDLAGISQQEAEIAEQELVLEQMQAKRAELKSRQSRVQQLRKAEATLVEIIAAYEAMAEARRELPVLEKQIAELERREREELPIQEKRVAELADLTRSFGTLQRMSNDLLTAVDTIKELEQELKRQDELTNDLKGLDEQVIHAQSLVAQAQQALTDLEKRRHKGRPILEARLQRMKALTERLGVLREVEDQYMRCMASKELVGENRARLKKVQKDLRETEQELTLVENEAKQAQKQADALEKRWRQLSVRRQLEEWQRLKGLSQGLTQAEQHVKAAYGYQEQLTQAALVTHRIAKRYMSVAATCIILLVLCVIMAAVGALEHIYLFASGAGVAAIVLVGVAGVSLQSYSKAREEEKVADKQVQDAISRVGMMVVAREAATRMGGSQEALAQVEHEIRSLGGAVPHSLEEVQRLLQQTQESDESVADIQQQMTEKREEANASRNQVNVTMEAVASLRKERALLEEQRQSENWDTIDERLYADQVAVERMHQEIMLLAGQEGLPQLSINERLRRSSTSDMFSSFPSPTLPEDQEQEEDLADVPDLDALVESTIKASEREIAALDDRLDLVTDLESQVKIHQEALDVLLVRKRLVEERNARYQTNSPTQQIERAREQQMALRSALQTLQDSLRQRVKPLKVIFGQTAISNAEMTARKQLEELQITLGSKLTLQSQYTAYATLLKERQESLSEHYKQLAKFSNSLGSWIVPLNPFAEALAALRSRCQREIEEADEAGILRELENAQAQEGASRAKIDLCRQEIEDMQERIATMLVQRNRPTARSYTLADIAAVWPLLGEYSVQDRSRLQVEREELEQELIHLEEQELALSMQLQVGSGTLDLEQTRARMAQQERSYQIKKRGNLLVKAVNERLLRKMLPRTEYYVQQILPLLTSGRYHDVRLTTDAEEGAVSGGPFKLSAWDSAAGEYVPKSALSGGASDQLSLALRLAFAIAALPHELNAAPGFVLLDEPLSSFDRSRAQALVEVITGEVMSQHFEQILLISHSGAFDPTMFPYHIYMDNGLIVESNLPVTPVPSLPLMDVQGKGDEENPVIGKVAVPASVGVE